MTLTSVGSTTLDGVQRAPSGGLALWDYSNVYDIDVTTGIPTRTSPPIPRETGEFSPAGVGYVDPKTGEFWVLCANPGHPLFRKLSADFTTWTDVGVTPTDEPSVSFEFGVVRVNDTLVTIVFDGNAFKTGWPFAGGHVVRGYSLTGVLEWSYIYPNYAAQGGDTRNESFPECGTTDGERYIYFTTEGPTVHQFDAVSRSADPVAVIALTDPASYWEYPNDGSTDPRLDIDINGSFAATDDGLIYAWGNNEGYMHGSTDRNQVFGYKMTPSGSWTLIGEGDDGANLEVTQNYRSFSGTCTAKDGKLYLLNSRFNPYVSSFDLATGAYTSLAISLQGAASGSPSALCGTFGHAPGVISAGKLLDTKPVYAPIRPLA